MLALSLVGFYRYSDKLFDTLELPPDLDKDLVIDSIIIEGGQFEPIYTDWSMLQYAIGVWGKRHYRTFERWIKALNIEYNPLHNYDRYEFSNDGEKFEESTSRGQEIDNSTNSTSENNVSAFNSGDYSPKEQDVDKSNANQKLKENFGHDSDRKNEHSAHLYGNIGVTTSQEMLRDELDIAKFDLYGEIAKMFKEEMLIAVY